MIRRENSTHRRAPSRQPYRTILVVCGGLRTEPAYFDGLKRWTRNAAVRVKVVGSGRSPSALVECAVKTARGNADGYDELWCVFDVDDFSITEAEREARRHGVRLAVSNPCFEL